MIKNVSYEINNKDINNSNLYLITVACNKLSEIVYKLPDNEFKRYFKETMKENLSQMTCYVIDNNLKINCNDFYENFLKRKKVNEEILSKVKLKTGGVGSLVLGIAIAAVALLQTTNAVSGATFYGNDLVRQHNGIMGIRHNNGFIENLFQGKPRNSFDPLVHGEKEVLIRLDANLFGVCMSNSFVAEICTGGCPSLEQWEKLSPDILQKIKTFYRNDLAENNIKQEVNTESSGFLSWLSETITPSTFRPEPEKKYSDVFVPPKDLNLGMGTHILYENEFKYVQDGFDVDWFRKYFSDGDKNYWDTKDSYADMAIATVRKKGHAFNVMYNRYNRKLCVHDENNKVGLTKDKTFWLPLDSKEYICETGFFTKYQIEKLNKLGKVVVETNENIFKVYNEQTEEPGVENKIIGIQDQEGIFLLDNSKNTGNTNMYIEIQKDIRKSMIEGLNDGIAFLENNKDRLKITSETLNILKESVEIKEKSFDINEPFNVRDSYYRNQLLAHELQSSQNTPLITGSLGGNKICFTSKIHRKRKNFIRKKSKKNKRKKSKSKTKRNK
jgi:hypothetical protein